MTKKKSNRLRAKTFHTLPIISICASQIYSHNISYSVQCKWLQVEKCYISNETIVARFATKLPAAFVSVIERLETSNETRKKLALWKQQISLGHE